jgi:prepilin peptidase CpaA
VLALYPLLGVVWFAAWVDTRSGLIPNAIPVAAVVLGLLVFLEAEGVLGLVPWLAGLVLGLAIMLPGYVLRSTGAGDVKLMGGVGALLGPQGVLLAFVLSIFVGAVIGIGHALVAWWTKGAISPFKRYGRMLRHAITTGRPSYEPPGPNEVMGQRFAFAVPIAIGSTVAAVWPL